MCRCGVKCEYVLSPFALSYMYLFIQVRDNGLVVVVSMGNAEEEPVVVHLIAENVFQVYVMTVMLGK